MRAIKIFSLSLAIAVAISTVAVGQSKPPAPGTPKDFKLPEKKALKLDNGLGAVLVPYGAIPKVNINLVIKTGNINEGANEVWLADLTGNLVREGSVTMDFKTIAKKVAAMGGQLNFGVSPNQITISGSVLSEFAPDLIKIMADVVMNPAFPSTEIDRLKNDLKRQLTVDQAVPQNQATAKFRSILYKDHSYGRIYPTEAMIDSYTLEKAKAFYDANVGAKRTVVYAVGKFNEANVRKAIEESFAKWKSGPEVNYPVATPQKSSEVAMIDRPGAPQTTVILGLPTLDPSKPDYLPLQVTNSLLGGSFGSRITKNIREDKGYTYSPFSTINAGYRAAIWYEQADVTTEHTGASLQEISKEIKRLQTEKPSDDDVKGIQNYEAGIFVLQNSTRGGIINQLNFLDVHGLPDAYLTDRVKNIYQITPDKIQQVAKDYFKYEEMTLVLVGDKKLLEKQIKEHQNALKVK
jgi:predicted Zn-dependent peptidase